jgi:hypothetical protein
MAPSSVGSDHSLCAAPLAIAGEVGTGYTQLWTCGPIRLYAGPSRSLVCPTCKSVC